MSCVVAARCAVQSLRFYLQVVLSAAAGGLGTYLSVILVPIVIGAIVSLDKAATGIALLWGVSSFTAVTGARAVSLYLGERLALDWRRALTRRVRGVSV